MKFLRRLFPAKTPEPKIGDHRKACCRNEKNLGPAVQAGPKTTFRRCTVCQCRHFEAVLDPGVIGIRGTKV